MDALYNFFDNFSLLLFSKVSEGYFIKMRWTQRERPSIMSPGNYLFLPYATMGVS